MDGKPNLFFKTIFFKQYFKVKDNIYVHSKNNNIKSFKDLFEKKLAIVKGYATVQFL